MVPKRQKRHLACALAVLCTFIVLSAPVFAQQIPPSDEEGSGAATVATAPAAVTPTDTGARTTAGTNSVITTTNAGAAGTGSAAANPFGQLVQNFGKGLGNFLKALVNVIGTFLNALFGLGNTNGGATNNTGTTTTAPAATNDTPTNNDDDTGATTTPPPTTTAGTGSTATGGTTTALPATAGSAAQNALDLLGAGVIKRGTKKFDGRLNLTQYGGPTDGTPDKYTQAGMGNRGNRLRETSLALSPDLIKKYSLKGGEKIYIQTNGRTHYLGTYDDTTGNKREPNVIDIYDPGDRLGRDSFMANIPAGQWSLICRK